MKLDAKQILSIAEASFHPAKRFVLFSGGNDSTTLLHWAARNADLLDGAVHINTGIGVEQTRQFVRTFCADEHIPLIEQCAPPGEYERLCTQYGVPGPGAHWQCYRYLKDRQIEALVREQCPPKQKGQVRAPIMLITGVRRDESTRRMGTTKPIKYRQNMAQLWVAPFIDWTRADLDEYRLSHDVPHNEVADVMHMSMECACGAFGSRDEFNMIATFYPELATQIVRAENLALDAGQQHHEWGRPRKEVRVSARQLEFTDLCSKCTM